MKGEMDFSDKWFRKRFRDEMEARTCRMPGETVPEMHVRILNYMQEHGVTISSSGKMAYDRNLQQNNCTNMFWPNRQDFLVWARQQAPDIFKKRGARPNPGPRGKEKITKPKQPTTTGWDDFDWSR